MNKVEKGITRHLVVDSSDGPDGQNVAGDYRCREKQGLEVDDGYAKCSLQKRVDSIEQ